MSVSLGAFGLNPGIRPSWRSFVAYAALTPATAGTPASAVIDPLHELKRLG